MSEFLCIRREGNWAWSVELAQGQTYRIGRAEDNDVVLRDRRVSSYHARLSEVRGMWTLEDLNSRNGTYVREQRRRKQELQDGDTIRLGETDLMFVDRLDSSSLDGEAVLSPRLSRPLMKTELQKYHDILEALKEVQVHLMAGGGDAAMNRRMARRIGTLIPRLEDTRQHLKVLISTGAFHEIFHHTPSLEAAWPDILQFLMSAIGAEDGAGFLVSEKGDLKCAATSGLGTSSWPSHVPPPFLRLLQDVVRSRRTVIISPHKEAPTPAFEPVDDRALMMVPVQDYSQQVRAVLYFDNRRHPERLDPKSVDLVSACAGVLGSHLSGIRRFHADTAPLADELRSQIRRAAGDGENETLC
jgi:pSer/pThr/pTyr-binding forkhead associated (FHA) protein